MELPDEDTAELLSANMAVDLVRLVQEGIENNKDVSKMISQRIADETDKKYATEQKKYEQDFVFIYQVRRVHVCSEFGSQPPAHA